MSTINTRDGTEKTGSHWLWYQDVYGKPLLAVDFHHTITKRCCVCPGEDPKDTNSNGDPQEGVAEYLTRLHKKFRIMIFTGSGAFWDEKQCATIKEYLDNHGIPYDEIRFDKPPAMFIVDDRAIHHIGWEETYIEIERRMEMV